MGSLVGPKCDEPPSTVHKLPLFREAFAKRRCLIPATGFYEWQQRDDGKQPFRFRRKDLEPFAFAGIWEFNRLGGEEIVSAAMNRKLRKSTKLGKRLRGPSRRRSEDSALSTLKL